MSFDKICDFFLPQEDKTVAEAWEQKALDRAKQGFTGISQTYYLSTRRYVAMLTLSNLHLSEFWYALVLYVYSCSNLFKKTQRKLIIEMEMKRLN